MQRVCIVGGPRCGKTTLAGTLAVRPVRHTDDLIGACDWSQVPDVVADWFGEPGPWVVEGVAVARGLRRWLQRHPLEAKLPCEVVYLRFDPFTPLSAGQSRMLRGVRTVWLEVAEALVRRGVALR